MPRKFKPGDWVKLKGKQVCPKMEVLKYIPKKDAILGVVNNETYLQCVWYQNGNRNVETFNQNRLLKLTKTGGLYKV
ncbi:hypothetical protein [Aequorivita viscosa]|uniref:DUF2158 domain-containing protein n=1 Tax=Aequorivita viscosa TaxID=797419 RepID=A0A1M6H7Y3_9FLAO|nr:hypothetical protein [Aequorivita viscosa]SDW89140.1 hypothetical protein SAMN05216556_1123 [Aequorivita viscosa]SHJ18249.1 hypothetical protein SAMN04487908_1113 [Aequorivita viscosa]